MKECKNCFTTVDLRSAVKCSICNSLLHKDCAIKKDGTFFCDVCYTDKKDKPSYSNIDFKIPEVIRRSHIETYLACPYKFYMEVIKGIKQPDTIYTLLGRDLHEQFEIASKEYFSKKDMIITFKHIFDMYNDNLFDSPEQKEKLYMRGIYSIDNFYDILPTLPEPLSTEDNIIFSIGENLPKVSTTSDRINNTVVGLEILDWKTGVVMVGKKLSSDLQAPLYIYGVRKKYQKQVNKFTFYYLQNGKTRVFERINDDDYVCTVRKRQYYINITDTIRKVQHIFSQINKGMFNIPKDTSKLYFTCKTCHLQDKKICKGAYLESWYQYNKS